MHRMTFTADDALIERAEMRCRCSCLEEYLIERDLRFDMSKIEKMLDFIEIVERHPKICAFFSEVDLMPATITLLGSCFSFLMSFAVNMMLLYFDPSIYVISVVSYAIGIYSIAFAFSIKVSDAKFAVKIAKMQLF